MSYQHEAGLREQIADANIRIVELEAALAEAQYIIKVERQGWKIALRTLIDEPQHASIIGNPASIARAEIDEIGASLVALAEAREHAEQYRQNWLALQKATGEECQDRALEVIAEAREDSARLEWLDSQGRVAPAGSGLDDDLEEGTSWYLLSECTMLRHAIDSARGGK